MAQEGGVVNHIKAAEKSAEMWGENYWSCKSLFSDVVEMKTHTGVSWGEWRNIDPKESANSFKFFSEEEIGNTAVAKRMWNHVFLRRVIVSQDPVEGSRMIHKRKETKLRGLTASEGAWDQRHTCTSLQEELLRSIQNWLSKRPKDSSWSIQNWLSKETKTWKGRNRKQHCSCPSPSCETNSFNLCCPAPGTTSRISHGFFSCSWQQQHQKPTDCV